MASVNKVILVGNLGRDPEIRYTAGGDAICNLSLATTDNWKDKASGERKELTEWHRVVFFGKIAEIAGQYLRKGSQVYVEGSLRTRKWTDQNGQDRYTTEVRGDEMKMLGSRSGVGDAPMGDNPQERSMPRRDVPASQQQGFTPPPASASNNPPPASSFDNFEDDIPF